MGYAQWVVFVIENATHSELRLQNVWLKWGKWHQIEDKDGEIVSNCDGKVCAPFEGSVIRIGHKHAMASCGREHSPSGTEGEFDVFDGYGERVCHVYWSCPWGAKTNVF